MTSTESRRTWWAVRLLLDDEHIALDPVIWKTLYYGARKVDMRTASPELGEPASLTFELHADNADVAEKRAQALVARAQVEVDLPYKKLPVVWVAPLTNSEESSLRFLEQARDQVESGQYELAVIAAQTHFETQVRTLLTRAAQATGAPWAAELAAGRWAASLGSPDGRAAVERLLGIDVTKTPEWTPFQAHLKRRNAVAHGGSEVSPKEAAASFRVVRELWLRLNDAARANEPPAWE